MPATVQNRGPQCFANQHECRCCRGFRKRRQCMTHYVPTIQQASSSHYTSNPYIYPQCQCNRKKHYTPNRDIHPQCITLYSPNGYIHAQLNSNYTPNRNILPQCNRLCLRGFYRSCVLLCQFCFYSHKKYGANRDSRHI